MKKIDWAKSEMENIVYSDSVCTKSFTFFRGSLTRDFRFQAFFVNQFPRAHEYPIGAYLKIKG
jgi:hypothetical protein